jgi:hypothetical protein
MAFYKKSLHSTPPVVVVVQLHAPTWWKSAYLYMKIYVPSVILPLKVFTTDTDYFLCVVQAETKETADHENIRTERV